MGITDKIRKRLSTDRNNSTTPSNDRASFDTMKEEPSPRSLPIADEFMRYSAMPQSSPDVNQGYGYDQSAQHSPTMPQSSPKIYRADDNIQSPLRQSTSSEMNRSAFPQRKPVPNEVDRTTSHPVPQNSTVRIVPNQNATSESAQDHSGFDSVLNFSRLHVGNPSNSTDVDTARGASLEQDRGAGTNASKEIPRSSLEKPLPMPPVSASDSNDDSDPSKLYDRRGVALASTHDLERELGVEGQVDLSNTAETDVQNRGAPAVTHETIRQDEHEIREERITRDIHQDHVFHRILPIEEVEVLPARHYVRDSNGALQDVTEQWKSRRTDRYIEKGIVKGFEKVLPKANVPAGRRTFTAREFHGDEGDHKGEYLPDGSVRSERYWVHPPTLETGSVESGQTHPFHLGSSNPEDDGWRTTRT